jgi:hypothetical protein
VIRPDPAIRIFACVDQAWMAAEDGGHIAPVVELPGIEPDALPSNMPSELPVRSVSVRFTTSGYLRFRFRVLTA